MALADTLSLDRLPPWALYGGAGLVAGGGYLLYRRRKAAAAGAPAAAAPAPAQSFDPNQQPSLVPYYLTADQGQGTQGTGRQRPTSWPRPAVPPPATNVTGTSGGAVGSVIPPIPPILPGNVTVPQAQTAASSVLNAFKADPCAGKSKSVPGFEPAPPGMWAEPIMVQGQTIGVAYHPC